MHGGFRQRGLTSLFLGVTVVAVVGVWLPLPFALRLVVATLLTFFLPGWFLLQAIRLAVGGWIEQVVVSVGVSCGITVLGSLGILYATGHLSAQLDVGMIGGLTLILGVISLLRPAFSTRRGHLTGMDLLAFFLPVAVAAFFSFTNLGYSDYWGDEMNGLLRAISVISGRPTTLFEHTKGPVEVLLPATFGLLAGRFDPFAVRFPFALAHVAAVGGFYLLVRRMFGRNVGLLAAVILALNGLYLAFGRIVQYQAVVFLMTSLSLLMACRFCREGDGKYLALSSFFVGVGLLAHYDMLLVLPPLTYLVWRRHGWRWQAWKADRRWLALAGLILLAILAAFYVPFFLHPHLSETSSYLTRIVGAANWPINNFDELYVFAVMYNSIYYVIFIVLLGIAKVLWDLIGLFRCRYRDKGIWLAVGLAFVLGVLAVALGRPMWVPVFAIALLTILLIGFSSIMLELKIVYIWMTVSLIGYAFFVDHPRTHLQIIYPGWSVLVALAIVESHSGIRRVLSPVHHRETPGTRLRPFANGVVVGYAAILCALFGLFGAYEYLLFVDANTEYILTYPVHKSYVFWEDERFPFGSRRLYGAPHRLGWQMVNQLYLQGTLQGDWDSNDDGSNLFWYTLGWPRNPCYPRYYFATQFLQKGETGATTAAFPLTEYAHIGQVWNRDHLQIDVYEFAPVGGAGEMSVWSEPLHYDLDIAPGDFRSLPYEEPVPVISTSLPTQAVFRPSPVALQAIARHYGDPRITGVRDKAALLGYDLGTQWARPGGVVVLTLYWQAVDTVNLPYKTFVHLEGEGAEPKTWSQSDALPACGMRPTQGWQVGKTVTDRHVIELPPDIPVGDYAVRVGLYEPQTQQRMDVLDAMGNPQGTRLDLVHVRVMAAE